MKKGLLIIAVVLLSLCVLGGVAFAIYVTPQYEGEFVVEEYTDKISNPNFHSGKTYAPITDKGSAVEVGKAAIIDRFGTQAEERIYRTKYHAEEDVWCISAQPKGIVMGGSLYVLIRSDGTEVAIWGEK